MLLFYDNTSFYCFCFFCKIWYRYIKQKNVDPCKFCQAIDILTDTIPFCNELCSKIQVLPHFQLLDKDYI